MQKIKLFTGLLFGLFLLNCALIANCQPASAATSTTMKTTANLNVRQKAGVNHKSVTILKKGASIDVYTTPYQGSGCPNNNGWYKIASGKYKNKFVCSKYLTKSTSKNKTPASSTPKYINIKDMTYSNYRTNITLKFYGRTRSAQNFSIANLHTNNEIYYFTTVNRSYVLKTGKVTSDIYETYVLRVKRSDLKNTAKGKTISIPYSGHGQTFQLGTNGKTFWTNSDAGKSSYGGTPYKESGGKYWGTKNYGISQYSFSNTKGSKKQRLKLNSTFQSELKSSIDFKNRKMALIRGKTVFMVNFTNKAKDHKTYESKFTLKRTYNGKKLYSQGYALYNGYFYEYLNDNNSGLYISCYHTKTGKTIYLKKINLASSKLKGHHLEAEGMQIIDGKPFIGIRDIDRKTFTIGTFK